MTILNHYRTHLQITIGLVALLMCIVCVLIPLWLRSYVTAQLETLSGYEATFEGIQFSPWKAKYALLNIQLYDRSQPKNAPVFEARRIEFGLSGRALFTGTFSGKISVIDPTLRFVSASNRYRRHLDLDYPWKNICQRLLHLKLKEIIIRNGRMFYTNMNSSPQVNLKMEQIELQVEDLDRIPGVSDEMVARVEGNASIYEGKFNFTAHFNPASSRPVFHLIGRLNNLDLSHLSDYLAANGNYSIEKGLFSMVAQASGDDENVSGFVKPALETINLVSSDGLEHSKIISVGSPFSKAYPQIPFHDDLKEASLSTWSAIAYTLRNAFLEALMPVIKKINTGKERPMIKPKTGAPLARACSLERV
jgi:hypothetical protein